MAFSAALVARPSRKRLPQSNPPFGLEQPERSSLPIPAEARQPEKGVPLRKNTDASAVYKLEPVTDDPRFEGFAFKRAKSLRGKSCLAYDFGPDDVKEKGRGWTVPRMASTWAPQKVVGRVRPFNDYPCIDLTVPAFSRRAVDALGEYLEPNGELLPLVSALGEYFAYNLITVADVLDHKRSKIQWFDDSEPVIALEIDHFEFLPDRLVELSIFHIVEDTTATFVTQRFVETVDSQNLQGFEFVKVWALPTKEGRSRSMRKDSGNVSQGNARSKTKDVVGNTVVIFLPLTRSKPSKMEIEGVNRVMDAIDAALCSKEENAAYVGSLEGHEYVKCQCRLFLSCPDADLLVKKLRSLFKRISWHGRVEVLKRYGPMDDVKCREVALEL